MAQTDSNIGAADRESVHARVLNASREQVFYAFREPEHFERVKSFVAEANEQNLDRLAGELTRVTCDEAGLAAPASARQARDSRLNPDDARA
jgi:hypothetical protein